MHIPNPCYEDWSRMTPTSHGRNCASCNSLVADMIRLSNDEILSLISKEKVHCGRFYEDQLQTPQIKEGVLNAWFGRFGKEWAFLSMLALLELSAPSELSAKSIKVEQIEEGRKHFAGDTGMVMPGFIQGAVLKTNTTVFPVSNREVFIYNHKGKKVGVVKTDDKGMFAFALPDGISQDTYTLVLKGYRTTSRYRRIHYHKVEVVWSPSDTWIDIYENPTSKKKLLGRRRMVVTGKFR